MSTRFWFLAFLIVGSASPGQAATDERPLLHCYLSTGDNHWLGQSLPIDSPASIEASFDLLHRLGVKRVYWRGLEAATWVDMHRERPESVRYFEFWKWLRHLYRNVQPDRLAVAAARKRGMEIWGVANLFDWGGAADVPPFKHYPFNSESRLRIDHPEWVPVDRSGLLRQGGPLELAYPEARRALIDLHMKFMRQDGYDGMTFLTYAENHSMRFQDEYGFSEPIVEEFQKRHRIDIRYQDWTRFASRHDWLTLRGEYVTQFLRELKSELDQSDQGLGFFLQPWEPRQPQPWNVPEIIQTAGSMYLDLETWVKAGLIDDFLVYGYANRDVQLRAVHNIRWLTRETPVNVGILTSGPKAAHWKPFQKECVPTVIAYGEDAMYLDRSFVPEQPMSSLASDDPLLVMKALSQVIHGQSQIGFNAVQPLLNHPHLIVRRLTLQALGKIGNEPAIAALETALFDSENSIRCMAGLALRDAHGPETTGKILQSIRQHGNHMLAEIMRVTLPRIRPLPRAELAAAYDPKADVKVRQIVMRALVSMSHGSLIPTWERALRDPDRFTRVAAVRGLGRLQNNDFATRLLSTTLAHDDPVMANEASVALGDSIRRGDSSALKSRTKILQLLTARYSGFGDAYAQADADWGYRPVGNALLAFGDEGESVLQTFIDQGNDQRLAINAWKSLYIRQRPGTFSEVTERQHAEAMRHRPLFLKKPVVPRLRQDFDDTAVWRPETRGTVGDVNQVSGRWGALLDDGPNIQEGGIAESHSLSLRRGGQSFTGQAVPPVSDEADYELRFKIRRMNDTSAAVIQLRGFAGTFKPELAVSIAETGELRLRDMTTDKWVASGLHLAAEKWSEIRVLANRRRGRYSASVILDERESAASKSVPLHRRRNLRSITFHPQPPVNSAVLIDDISLMEVR